MFQIIPRTAFIDEPVPLLFPLHPPHTQSIDSIQLDTAMQHISSYLVCVKLGQSVESACHLYRQEKSGMINEASRTPPPVVDTDFDIHRKMMMILWMASSQVSV